MITLIGHSKRKTKLSIIYKNRFKIKKLFIKYMGNNSSTSNLQNCSLCNLQIPTRNFAYYDLVCSKCNLRCKSYYHNDCIRNYRETQLNSVFVCPPCNNNFNKISQLST